ncbi:DNA polymerase III subunit gamma/tau [Dorea longicatena]|mgnify:FL=1|jgi:DNA polymerase-3 subunit gamma/tau|uniref:DNA polymerase III subunit gamma/tau n=1 Tax=Dorea longicatena TaxID=88431 RepID=UPI0015705A61|nr:DNA polymerase III subunit gamma/tau [Dorea longicatena]NSE36671.1 DNA polymerase III subunit gamma/tau [Dorea longicatena]NSE38513.1 DNA polymerase III subunit gamma/tau [Dorea longicatena]NSE42523.1 DNA polymerase III subunit gamma/tau [Dorea longicatena]UOX52757.1 DNA polymerase III subunit gamma/tau [Dorea longicatena]
MSYTALYRKFRPDEFEDVKGQDAIVRTLKNQINADRIGHAYLFCGTRGTGKTTVAKIFAKAVNCEHPVDGSPCGECAMCKSIAAGTSMNVIEIDAASNNGVDNIREIREEVTYRPTEGKYKVYIIDEVHMLSIGAFNALLKTLEEPPEYVIFILATTEAHKIPITILSRCQRYDFKRISIETIAARLRELIDKEGWDVEDKAVRYIAKMADGSMRDSLSLLDQCAAFYMNETLTYDHVLEVLGAVDTEVFSRLLRQLLAMDVHQVIETIDELVMQGRELSQLAADFTWYLRNLLLVKSSDNMEDVLDVSSENLALLKEEAQMIDSDTLIRYIRIFSDLTNQLKYATQKRVLLEVTLIKLCRPAMDQNKDALLDRIRAIEKQLEEGAWEAPVRERIVYASDAKEAGEPKPKPELPQALNEDVKAVAKDFRMIINEASPMLRTYLKKARLSAGEGNRLLIVLPDELSASAVATPEHKEEIQSLIEQKIGKKVEIDVRQMEAGRRFEDNFVDLENLINMEITVEDE